MPKPELHQLLAVLDDLRSSANAVLQQAKKVFQKTNFFQAVYKVFKPSNEEDASVVEVNQELPTTVTEKLKGHVFPILAEAIDLELSIEETNNSSEARADIEIDGKKINLSATALLRLEKKVKEIITLLNDIPTLDVQKNWKKDEQRENVFIFEDAPTIRTKKKQVPLVLHPGTDKHPPQTEKITEDIPIGQLITRISSGEVSSAQKAEWLERATEFLKKVTLARTKANTAVAVQVEIANSMFSYIMGDGWK